MERIKSEASGAVYLQYGYIKNNIFRNVYSKVVSNKLRHIAVPESVHTIYERQLEGEVIDLIYFNNNYYT